MDLDRLGIERLRSLLEPFDGEAPGALDRPGVALAIEDHSGHVLVTSGGEVDPAAITVRSTIELAGEPIGQVVARGIADRRLLEAIAGSIGAAVAALAELSGERLAMADDAAAAVVRLDAELALGRRIQRSLVPLVPATISGYEIATHYEAAREVGGDFFDVFRIRGRRGRLAICIADVSGKGIAAALLMAFVRPLLRAAVDHVRSPARALEQTNRILVDERRSALFITALCATVELRGGILRLANAGHEPPLLVPGRRRADRLAGGLRAAPRRVRPARPCGARRHPRPGDLVLLYTDGVTDAQAPSGLRFGDHRLIEALETARGGSAADAVEAVCDAYHRFQADQPNADDVAIVALRRAPRPGRR